jgi:cation:H+ antiporter
MLVLIVKILAGFIGLIWSADKLVVGASALASRLGISHLVIGLTIIAFGTSAPEIFVSLLAGLKNNTDIAVGNAIGSNIANIGFVLGICICVKTIPFQQDTIKAELPFLIIVTLLISFFMWWLDISLAFGLLSLIIVAGYVFWLLNRAHKQNKSNNELEDEFAHEINDHMSFKKIYFLIGLGIVLLPLSAELLVSGASTLASILGVSDAIIGLTLLAIGTSLPELATCLVGIFKNEHNIALGNIIGSNIFNLTAVLIPVAFISNKHISDPMIFTRDIPFMIFITLLICGRIWFNGAQTILSWRFGIVLFGLYCSYMLLILSHSLP